MQPCQKTDIDETYLLHPEPLLDLPNNSERGSLKFKSHSLRPSAYAGSSTTARATMVHWLYQLAHSSSALKTLGASGGTRIQAGTYLKGYQHHEIVVLPNTSIGIWVAWRSVEKTLQYHIFKKVACSLGLALLLWVRLCIAMLPPHPPDLTLWTLCSRTPTKVIGLKRPCNPKAG